jgi:iron complex transport system permease protein
VSTTLRTVTPPVEATAPRHRSTVGLGLGVLLLTGVLAVVAFVSITIGARGIGLQTIWTAFTDYDPTSAEQTVIRELRVPRTLLGLLVGAALGLAGALLQGVTRNPLADPGIMGINLGAAAGIVVTVLVTGGISQSTSVWVGFLGAGIAVVVVYGVASFGREGATPVKLALAGAAVSAALYSITTGVTMTDLQALNELRFWQVGSLSGRYLPVLDQTWPFLVAGLVVALLMGRSLNGLALGDDLAVALGQRVRLTRVVVFVTVALLGGAATAACGPIVFVGLIVPHIARALTGPDYRWVLPYTFLLSPIILLGADVLGRVLVSPSELQVGVVLGAVGAPAFIWLVRRKDLAQL